MSKSTGSQIHSLANINNSIEDSSQTNIMQCSCIYNLLKHQIHDSQALTRPSSHRKHFIWRRCGKHVIEATVSTSMIADHVMTSSKSSVRLSYCSPVQYTYTIHTWSDNRPSSLILGWKMMKL